MPRSAGGLRDAACSAAKPPHDTPIIPTAPVHHGCSASQAITASTSRRLLRGVLVVDQPVRVAAAAQVDPHARVPVAGEVAVPGGVAAPRCRRPCGRARRPGSRAPGSRSASSGSQIARSEPAAVGQRDPQVLDVRTVRGKSVRICTLVVDAVGRAGVFSHIRHAKGSFTQ